MSTKQMTVSTPDMSTLQEWEGLTGKHTEALKAVRSCKNFAEFQSALPVATSLLRDGEAAQSAVDAAKALIQVGQAVADAHTTYRVNLVSQYLRWVPKVTNRDLARDLFGSDEESITRHEKMIARDRKALAVIGAAKEGRAHAPEGASISVPSPAAALKMVKHATVADTKAMVARAKAGEPIVLPQEKEASPVGLGKIVSRLSSVVDDLSNVDNATVTDATIKALQDLLVKASAKVATLTVPTV